MTIHIFFLENIATLFLSEISCSDPGNIYNATYSLSGLLPGDTANYTCVNGSLQQAGDAVRTCQSDGYWNGIPIVCSTPCACKNCQLSTTLLALT